MPIIDAPGVFDTRSRPSCGSGRSRQANRRAGFTLIELMLVMLILAIVAVNVAPKFADAVGKHCVRTAGQRIKVDMEQAKLRARHTSVPQQVVFAAARDEYFVPGAQPLDRGLGIYCVKLTQKPYSTSIVAAEFSSATDSDIEFNPHGIPDTGGFVLLQAGPFQQTVTVLDDTGHVELSPITRVP